MSAWVPHNTLLGILELVEVLLYHDRPVLLVCKSRSGQQYLGLFVDDKNDGEHWLYLPLSRERLAQIKTGHVDLRTAFADPEDGNLLLAVETAGDWRVDAVLSADLDQDWLPLAETRLELKMQTLEARHERPSILAAQSKKVVLDLSLIVPGAKRTEVPARVLGRLLDVGQELLYSIGQAIEGRATMRGKVDDEIIQGTNMLVTGTFAGSFVVRMTAADPSLFPHLAEASLDKMIALLNLLEQENDLRIELRSLQGRVVSKLKALLKLIIDNRSEVLAEYASSTKGRSAHVSIASAVSAVRVVEEIGDELSRSITITGKLMGVMLPSKRFIIVDEVEGSSYKGKITAEALSQAAHAVLSQLYSATIREDVEVDSISGEERPTYYLLSLSPLPAPPRA